MGAQGAFRADHEVRKGQSVNHQQGGTAMCKQLNVQKSLTLIELMIVVAMIGILSAFAIPYFSAYQARSRQSEASTNLGAIFVSEVAFFGENNRYSDFATIGFTLAGVG